MFRQKFGICLRNRKTAEEIDAETRAKTKYDIYIQFKNTSKKYVANELDKLIKEYNIPETDWQTKHDGNALLTNVYKEYINFVYLDHLLTQSVSQIILISMPVIIIAAMMMASFMTNWTESNSTEYGILGTIGANRRQLCAISAGQIMLISLIASVPVILISAAISNTYISIYNSASSTDVNFVYSIPWPKLIEASLWFVFFSCIFTYVGISKLTKGTPTIKQVGVSLHF